MVREGNISWCWNIPRIKVMRNIKIILIGFIASVVLVNLGYYITVWMEPENYWPILVYTCIFSPIWEEAVFRWAPIEIFRRTGILEKTTWPLIILTSVLFAYIHEGQSSILIQGIFGLILSVVYLQINSRYSYMYVVSLHSIWNLCIFFGLISNQ